MSASRHCWQPVLTIACVLVTVTFNRFETERNTIRDQLLPAS